MSDAGEIVEVTSGGNHADSKSEHMEVRERRASSEARLYADQRHSNATEDQKNEVIVVEFVPPVEGTPAAEALAANKNLKVSKVTKGYQKFRGMKRPKMKNFNFMKKLNKTTKRKKKHFSKNFKGKVIDGLHELYTLTAGIMLGVRYAVGNANKSRQDPITITDFTSVDKVAFPASGDTSKPIPTPPHDLVHTFKFKSYAPKIFHRLREFFDISAQAYQSSVCGDYNFIEFISNSKSGQFFFYSHDGQYMLKTQTKEENKFMIRILPHYYQYLTENPNSMLVRILGMHRIKMYHLRRKVHFVVMTSVFDTPAQINTIYDLKGSLIGRNATAKERESGGVLKDNDLLDDKRKFHLGAKKAAFMEQLEKDARFLAKLNIMDYSLLVGVHDRRLRTRETIQLGANNNGVTSPSGATGVSPPGSAGANGHVSFAATTETVPSPHAHPEAGHGFLPGVTKSNTPFRRASVTHDQGGHETAAVNSLTTPSATARRKRASTTGSTTAHQQGAPEAHSEAADAEQVRVSLDEGDAHIQGIAVQSGSRDAADQHTGSSTGEIAPEILRSGQVTPPPSKPFLSTPAGIIDVATAAGALGGEDYNVPVDDDHEADYFSEEEEGEEEGEYEGEDDDASEYEDIDAGDSDDESSGADQQGRLHPPGGELVVEGDGSGAEGLEGNKLAHILRPEALHPKDLEKDHKNGNTGMHKSTSSATTATDSLTNPNTPATVYTYGPGSARRHPWTARRDEGINSRTPDGSRGDEIYYLGIIDILQQYNANKQMETVFKGFTNDAKQISSVPPNQYAERFIRFMDANID